MKQYARLATLSAVGVVAMLALTVFAYAARDAMMTVGVAVDQTLFVVVVVAMLLGVYLYFVKLARIELQRLAEEKAQRPPEP
jgi:hypothetical protein